MAFALGPRAQAAGYRLAAFDRIGSTNVEALARAREGERGSLWCVTAEQTAGRGRRNRAWIAPRGNLAASIVEVIAVTPAVAATLGFAAGLALEAALQRVSAEMRVRSAGSSALEFALKWPNDVLACGRKVAGILLEAEAVAGGLAVVVGMGTNVVTAPEGTPYPATSLAALGLDVTAEDLFIALSESWAEFRALWDDGRGFEAIRQAWLKRAANLHGPVSVQIGSSRIAGVFETIDDAGCMIVAEPGGGRRAVTAGDVYFGAAASAGAA